MDRTEFIVHLVIWPLTIFIFTIIAYAVLKKLIYVKRFCVSCQAVTRHSVDYGCGPVMGYLMVFMTLGWRTMIQQYYPVKCLICGQQYKTEAVENYRKQAGLALPEPGPKARDWKGLGGDRNWKELKLHQQIFLIVMICLGVLFTLFILLSKKKNNSPH